MCFYYILQKLDWTDYGGVQGVGSPVSSGQEQRWQRGWKEISAPKGASVTHTHTQENLSIDLLFIINVLELNSYVLFVSQCAKEVLCDPEKRSNYDKWRNSGIKISYKQWVGMKEHVQQVIDNIIKQFGQYTENVIIDIRFIRACVFIYFTHIIVIRIYVPYTIHLITFVYQWTTINEEKLFISKRHFRYIESARTERCKSAVACAQMK